MIRIAHVPDPARQDGGGSLCITATTAKDRLEVFNHFQLEDPRFMTSNKMLNLGASAGYENNAGWFKVAGVVPDKFLVPYLKLLKERTGYDEGLPDLDEKKLVQAHRVLHHTHYTRRLFCENGSLHYEVIVSSRDWQGKPAAKRAPERAHNLLCSELGVTKTEREFVELPNGLLRHNPNYLKQHDPAPGLHAEWFYHTLVDWWLKNKASPKQRQLVKRSADIMMRNHHGVSDLHCMRPGSGITHAWTKLAVSWEEFKNIKS